MYHLGLTFPIGWNAAAGLLKDDKLVAFCEEERLNKYRYCHRTPALRSMQYCLDEAGISLDDVDTVSFGWDHGFKLWPGFNLRRVLIRRFLLKFYGPEIQKKKIYYQNHHKSHVASAVFCSPFEESNFISLDSSGGDTAGIYGVVRGANVEVLGKLPIDQSWGFVYENITEAIGFLPHREEGKTMGLAAMGQPDIKRFSSWLDLSGELPNINLPEFKNYIKGLKYRQRHEDLNQEHMNLAATIQYALEQGSIKIAKWLHKKTGVKNLSLSGGCALNCSTNGRLGMLEEVENIYVQPAAHDAGTALGAAQLTYLEITGKRPWTDLPTPHFGPGYSDEEIEIAIKKTRSSLYKKSDNIAADVADLLVQKKVVGWFQGRMEFGPRALGGRSILGNPCDPEMKDIINKQIKNREVWRPFAPSMKEEAMPRYVDKIKNSPYMLVATYLRDDVKDAIPSATHIDGSVRIQTVNKEAQPVYWALCDEMEKRTGHPVVLNTSFNVAGQPIVCTPFDALSTFYAAGMDYLAIGDYLLWK
jgi:carbamoyltransferase